MNEWYWTRCGMCTLQYHISVECVRARKFRRPQCRAFGTSARQQPHHLNRHRQALHYIIFIRVHICSSSSSISSSRSNGEPQKKKKKEEKWEEKIPFARTESCAALNEDKTRPESCYFRRRRWRHIIPDPTSNYYQFYNGIKRLKFVCMRWTMRHRPYVRILRSFFGSDCVQNNANCHMLYEWDNHVPSCTMYHVHCTMYIQWDVAWSKWNYISLHALAKRTIRFFPIANGNIKIIRSLMNICGRFGLQRNTHEHRRQTINYWKFVIRICVCVLWSRHMVSICVITVNETRQQNKQEAKIQEIEREREKKRPKKSKYNYIEHRC